MSEHDPRTDPRPGDCVLVKRDGLRAQRRYVRWVQLCDDGETLVSWGTRRVVMGGNAYRTPLSTWRTETADAVIVAGGAS